MCDLLNVGCCLLYWWLLRKVVEVVIGAAAVLLVRSGSERPRASESCHLHLLLLEVVVQRHLPTGAPGKTSQHLSKHGYLALMDASFQNPWQL